MLMFFLIKYAHSNRCYIYIDIYSCESCRSSEINHSAIHTSLNVKFVMPEKFERIFKELHDKLLPDKIKKEEVIFSDSLSDKFRKIIGSNVFICDDMGAILYFIPLRLLNSKMDIINSYASYNLRIEEKDVPEELILTTITNIKVTENYIYMQDNNLKYIIKLPNNQNGKIRNYEIIDPIKIGFENLFKAIYKDTIGLGNQKYLYELAKDYFKSFTTFENYCVHNDTVYIIAKFHPIRYKHDSIFIDQIYYFLEFVNMENYNVYRLNYYFKKNYYIVNRENFYCTKTNDFIFRINQIEIKKPASFLGYFKIKKDSLVFLNTSKRFLPEIFLKEKSKYYMSTGDFHNNIYYFYHIPCFLNSLDSSKSVTLQISNYSDSLNKLQIFSSSKYLWISSIYETKNTIRMFFDQHDSVFIGIYNKYTGKEINKFYFKEFNKNNGKGSIGCVYFINESILCFASTRSNKIRYYILE